MYPEHTIGYQNKLEAHTQDPNNIHIPALTDAAEWAMRRTGLSIYRLIKDSVRFQVQDKRWRLVEYHRYREVVGNTGLPGTGFEGYLAHLPIFPEKTIGVRSEDLNMFVYNLDGNQSDRSVDNISSTENERIYWKMLYLAILGWRTLEYVRKAHPYSWNDRHQLLQILEGKKFYPDKLREAVDIFSGLLARGRALVYNSGNKVIRDLNHSFQIKTQEKVAKLGPIEYYFGDEISVIKKVPLPLEDLQSTTTTPVTFDSDHLRQGYDLMCKISWLGDPLLRAFIPR